MAIIHGVATAYTGANVERVDKMVWTESVQLLRHKFAMIGLEEVKEAFRLAAANRLSDVNMVSYAGIFTVAMFGDVLDAYLDYRKHVQAAILNAQSAAEHDAWEAARLESMRAQTRYDEAELIRLTHRNDTFERWNDVPDGWAKLAERMGLFEKLSNDDKGPIWVNAKHAAVSNILSDKPHQDINFVRRVRGLISSHPDIFPTELRDNALVIYRKMLTIAVLATFEAQKDSEIAF